MIDINQEEWSGIIKSLASIQANIDRLHNDVSELKRENEYIRDKLDDVAARANRGWGILAAVMALGGTLGWMIDKLPFK